MLSPGTRIFVFCFVEREPANAIQCAKNKAKITKKMAVGINGIFIAAPKTIGSKQANLYKTIFRGFRNLLLFKDTVNLQF